MKKNHPEETPWKPLIGFGIFILILATIIEKELALPPAAILCVMIVGGAGLLLASFSRPEIPLYVLAAYIPFNRILPGDFGGAMTALNLTNILCIIALVGLLAKISKGEAVWEKSSLNLPIILFALLGAISLLRGSWEYGTWFLWRFAIPLKRWLTPLLLYFLAFFIIRDRRTLKTLVLILMFAVTVVGLMAVKAYIDVGQVSRIEKARVGGIAENPNMLSAFFCYYMFLFGSFYLLNASKPRTWLLLIPFFICFRGIQVTFSRGGYLAFFMGALALAFFKSRKFFFFSLLALTFAFMNPVFLPKGVVYRLFSTFKNAEEIDPEGDDLRMIAADIYGGEEMVLEASSRLRLEIWRGALKMIADHPIWGTGYGTFAHLIPHYAPELKGDKRDAHNSYLIIAAEMGLPTLFVFLWIVFLVMWKTYRLYHHARDPFHKALALGFLAGLFGLLVSNMFGSRLHSEEVSGYFWILSGLIVRAALLERAAKPVPADAKPANALSRKRVSSRRLATPEGVVLPHSLSARLARFDKFKYGEKK